MDRRTFIQFFSLAGLAACGAAPRGASRLMAGNRRVQVYNLTMEGWSTLGSGHLGDLDQALLATQIRDFVTLANQDYTQDPHGHRFTVTPDDLAKILLGQEVRILTTYALDHRHEVRIKMSNHYDRQAPIEVEIDDAGHVVRTLLGSVTAG